MLNKYSFYLLAVFLPLFSFSIGFVSASFICTARYNETARLELIYHNRPNRDEMIKALKIIVKTAHNRIEQISSQKELSPQDAIWLKEWTVVYEDNLKELNNLNN